MLVTRICHSRLASMFWIYCEQTILFMCLPHEMFKLDGQELFLEVEDTINPSTKGSNFMVLKIYTYRSVATVPIKSRR